MRAYLFVIISVVTLVLVSPTFGSIRLNAHLMNATERNVIVFTYYGKVDKEIDPGEIGKFVFSGGIVLTVQVGNERNAYLPDWPPREFWISRIFSGYVKLLIDGDHRIYLVKESILYEDMDEIKASQPEGWPLVPLEPKEKAD